MLTDMQKTALKQRIESEYDSYIMLGEVECQALLGHIAFDYKLPAMASEDMAHLVAGYILMDRTNFWYGRQEFVKPNSIITLTELLYHTYESIKEDIEDMNPREMLGRITAAVIDAVDVLLPRVGDSPEIPKSTCGQCGKFKDHTRCAYSLIGEWDAYESHPACRLFERKV